MKLHNKSNELKCPFKELHCKIDVCNAIVKSLDINHLLYERYKRKQNTKAEIEVLLHKGN
jgi:hypothetical protein